MGEDSILEEERQKLFAMVWACPASEVARELGISGVALGKRCRPADTGHALYLAFTYMAPGLLAKALAAGVVAASLAVTSKQ